MTVETATQVNERLAEEAKKKATVAKPRATKKKVKES